MTCSDHSVFKLYSLEIQIYSDMMKQTIDWKGEKEITTLRNILKEFQNMVASSDETNYRENATDSSRFKVYFFNTSLPKKGGSVEVQIDSSKDYLYGLLYLDRGIIPTGKNMKNKGSEEDRCRC